MDRRTFQKYNIIAGWAVFAVALLCYALTVEPTVSFWDCGEYIATSAKLQVGHPPGAPFFQMVGAVFALFAPSPDKIALMVNLMSVLSSAFTILFLHFIVVNLAKKISLAPDEQVSPEKSIVLIGSGVVGSLAFCFSDSFWYNAVEAEVYAMAMLFMSAMFWLGLKWTDSLHKPRGNKWLLLICLVVGLSFGVHFMALLTIPAIGLLYFFNSPIEKNWKNFLLANVISTAILLLIFKLILPYTMALFGLLEIYFVNELNLPFNSGTIFAALLVLGFFIGLLYVAHRKQHATLQTATLCLAFVFIGFSSWLMIPIRANSDTVINENSPTDARLLLAYYNLEQYPETHLFKGPMYSDKYAGTNKNNPYTDEKPKYERDYQKGKYIIVNHYKNARMAPNEEQVGLLPRMWSSEHAANYMMLTGPLRFEIDPSSEYVQQISEGVKRGSISAQEGKEILAQLQGQVAQVKQMLAQGDISYQELDQFFSQTKQALRIEKPSFWENLYYLFSYQINYMYVRYFMWNFVGRQDDVQGKMDNHGNWLSGIRFIDELYLGLPQVNLPSDDANNKARNTYFFLPLLLGLLGFSHHYTKSQRGWWVVLVLFLFTGLALKIYLNERPFEPRERDYALVGSFFTFCIWIGLGVMALYDFVKNHFKGKPIAIAVVLLSFVAVPLLMACQNWDDHDRSEKYTARSLGQSYLDSTAKDRDAMLFSIGDNDTFALWYMQEVEGYRTDVRVINTSLLATDWYIDQMKRKAYTSSPIPSQMKHSQYAYGVRDVIYYTGKTDKVWSVKDLMSWIASEDSSTKITYEIEGEKIQFASYPTNKIRIPVNKENVLKSGVVAPKDADKIVDYIDITLPQSGIGKNRMMMLDIIANNDWKRPIYFTGGSFSPEEYIWMKDYLQLDGLVYKLVPIRTPLDEKNPYDLGRIDTELMYNVVMSWNWGNMNSPRIYHDPETRRNSIIYRSNLARLSEALIAEGKYDKARDVLNLSVEQIPVEYFGYYFTLEPVIEGYYRIGEQAKAREVFEKVAAKYQEQLNYYSTLTPNAFFRLSEDVQYHLQRFGALIYLTKEADPDTFRSYEPRLKNYINSFFGKASEQELMQQIHHSEPDSISPKQDTLPKQAP